MVTTHGHETVGQVHRIKLTVGCLVVDSVLLDVIASQKGVCFVAEQTSMTRFGIEVGMNTRMVSF